MKMWSRIALAAALAATLACAGGPVFAQQTPAARLLDQVATAMGGRDRLQRIESLVYTGFGQDAYMDGGGNITAEVNVPPKWRAIADAQRSFDLKSRRASCSSAAPRCFPSRRHSVSTGTVRPRLSPVQTCSTILCPRCLLHWIRRRNLAP